MTTSYGKSTCCAKIASNTRQKAGPGWRVGMSSDANGRSAISARTDRACFHAEQAQEECVEAALHADDHQGHGQQQGADLVELREALRRPVQDDVRANADASQE